MYMKYKKGTFVVIPNKEILKGKPAEMQSIYFWICEHSNDKGVCFPTKKTIADESGCSHNTVDKYLKQLVDDGFLSIEQRKKNNGKENTSNMYQIMIIDDIPELVGGTPKIGMTSPPKIGSGTNPSINQPNITNIETGVTLPIARGKTPIDRLLTIYRDIYWYTYKVKIPPDTYGKFKKIIPPLMKQYSELQLAYLFIVYFNWKGMTGDNVKEYNYLTGIAFPIPMFVANVGKYEIYIRNVLKENFDDDSHILKVVGDFILSIK